MSANNDDHNAAEIARLEQWAGDPRRCERCPEPADVRIETDGRVTYACEEHEVEVRRDALRPRASEAKAPRDLFVGQHEIFIALESVTGVPCFVGLGRPHLEYQLYEHKARNPNHPCDYNITGPWVLAAQRPNEARVGLPERMHGRLERMATDARYRALRLREEETADAEAAEDAADEAEFEAAIIERCANALVSVLREAQRTEPAPSCKLHPEATFSLRCSACVDDLAGYAQRRESASPEHPEARAIRVMAEQFEALGAEPCSECGYSLNEIRDYVHELLALRKVAEAARELTSWDWLHLLDDSVHSRDVRDDVERLTKALDGVPQTSEEPKGDSK